MEKLSRRERYLNKDEILADLGSSCNCGELCTAKIEVDTALLWRTRLHRVKEGNEKLVKVIELMQSMAASPDFKTFIANADTICRYVLISF